jgi:hypothetical protein
MAVSTKSDANNNEIAFLFIAFISSDDISSQISSYAEGPV